MTVVVISLATMLYVVWQYPSSHKFAMHLNFKITPFLLLVGLSCNGCYDGQALVERARTDAMRAYLAEVDLGTYRTTLPRDPATASITELRFHIFGTAPQYRLPAIEKQLEEKGYLLRYETLAAVRNTPLEELTEPDLGKLRARISEAVYRVLEETPIQAIGFHQIQLMHL